VPSPRSSRLLRIAVSLAVLVALALAVDPGALADAVRAVRRGPLLAAAALVPPFVLLRAMRWRALLDAATAGAAPGVLSMLRLTVMGTALNLLLPAGAGDVLKAWYASEGGIDGESAFATALYDKLLALAMLFPLGGAAAAYRGDGASLAACLVASAICWVLVLRPGLLPWGPMGALVRPLVGRRLDKAQLALAARPPLPVLLRAASLALAAWVVAASILGLLVVAVSPESPWLIGLLAYPYLMVGALFPLTLGGLGSAEAAAVMALARWDVVAAAALVAVVLWRALLHLGPAAVGALFLLGERR